MRKPERRKIFLERKASELVAETKTRSISGEIKSIGVTDTNKSHENKTKIAQPVCTHGPAAGLEFLIETCVTVVEFNVHT